MIFKMKIKMKNSKEKVENLIANPRKINLSKK